MSPTTHPTHPCRRRTVLLGALVALTAAAGQPPQPPPPPEPAMAEKTPAPTVDSFEQRRRRYLELGLDQLRGLERAIGGLGPSRDAAGALAAGVLAAAGAQTRGAAQHHTTGALADCSGRWHTVDCSRAALFLQRLVLQAPDSLEPELLAKLSREVASGATPPAPEAVRDPWGFRETENQRAVTLARSLVGQVVAGAAGSAAARAWSEAAEAFLRAHERQGWYEADSPGYLPTSMSALLLLADHAPTEPVRRLASRQLHLLFAAWAQCQAGGYPAGAKTRAYGHWALSPDNVPWRAWAWLLAGLGDPARITFRDWPDLAASHYRVPEVVAALLAERRSQEPYSVEARRQIDPGRRKAVDAALHTWATPDYLLSAAQSVAGMRLEISGGHGIVAALFPEGEDFAPVYLWSRTGNPRVRKGERWTGQDLAVGWRRRVVARLGEGHGGGHVYLAPPWGEPAVEGDLALARLGDVYLALVTEGGWELGSATGRFPGFYQDRRYRAARVLVAVRQPASVGLLAGRRAEDGSFESFREAAGRLRLSVVEGKIHLRGGGPEIVFDPGRTATVDGEPLRPQRYPLLAGPFLSREGDGGWSFGFRGQRIRLAPIERPVRPPGP